MSQSQMAAAIHTNTSHYTTSLHDDDDDDLQLKLIRAHRLDRHLAPAEFGWLRHLSSASLSVGDDIVMVAAAHFRE